MNFLLDTHTLLWYLQDSKQLSSQAAEILEDSSNTLWFSIASLWEISILAFLFLIYLLHYLQS